MTESGVDLADEGKDISVPVESMTEIMQRLENRKSGRGVREAEFLCMNCESTDKGRFFVGEAIPMAINCYHCKAGSGLTVDQQLIQKKGMLRVEDPEEEKN